MEYEHKKYYLGKLIGKDEYEPIQCFIDILGTWFFVIGDKYEWKPNKFSDIKEFNHPDLNQ